LISEFTVLIELYAADSSVVFFAVPVAHVEFT
jgi:hypothetical protein